MSALICPMSNLQAPATLHLVRGDGVYVYDQIGKGYLDGFAGLWCTSLGYNHLELIEAATAQMHTLSFAHLFGGRTHQVSIDLAEQLAAMVPINQAKIFFGSSGSDANDTHIKLLRYYFNAIGKPEKHKIIARECSYHGLTVASACLTGLTPNHTHFDLPFSALGILRTAAPYYYREALPEETEAEFVDRLANQLEQLILQEGPETIAAFIAEPITGASGVIVPPDGYFSKIQAILNQYDILLWVDEVITGFGRTGYDFGTTACQIEQPAMMTLAKQLSSGYMPISASAVRGDFYTAIAEQSAEVGMFGHGYTYSGHPVACAVALKTIEIYQRDHLFEHAAQVGAYLQQKLRIFIEHPLVGEVRGQGLLAGLELVAHKESGKPFATGAVGAYAVQACQAQGLILRAVAGNTLACCPPLIITKTQIDELIDKLSKALDDTLAFATHSRLLV